MQPDRSGGPLNPPPLPLENTAMLANVGTAPKPGAPVAGPLCAVVAWRLTPGIARARLARIGRRRGSPLRPDEHANWQVWGYTGRQHGPLWRTFLAEQRALLRELGELEHAIGSVQAAMLVLARPMDTLVPLDTACLH